MLLSSQSTIVSELLSTWRDGHTNIAILEGFAGLGKSDLTQHVFKAWPDEKVFITSPEGGDLDDVLLDIASQLDLSGNRFFADFPGGDYAAALLAFLNVTPALVVIDDFELLLDSLGSSTSSSVRDLLDKAALAPGPGKILLVTTKRPAGASWTRLSRLFTLGMPDETEAVGVLERLLADQHKTNEVPPDQLRPVVKWLGYNPRAMRAFVACLAGESLEELVDLSPDIWASQETPSRVLLEELELAFWRKTLGNVGLDENVLAENLSVMRRPFTIDAIKLMSHQLANQQRAKDQLISAFILERTRNFYKLNPLVRRLSGTRLSTNERRRKSAHIKAASFFDRRIEKASERDLIKSGTYFTEASYHYARAGRNDEAERLGGQFSAVLRSNFRRRDLDGLDAAQKVELTAILLGAIPTDGLGFSSLRSVLVRLLVARDASRDRELALHHARIASRESREMWLWQTLARLTGHLQNDDALLALGERAITQSEVPSRVLREIAEELNGRGSYEAAVRLLTSGAEKVARDQLSYVVSALAYSMDRAGRPREAIRILVHYYESLATEPLAYRLYEEACFMAYQLGDSHLLTDLRDLNLEPDVQRSKLRVALAEILKRILDKKYLEATMLGKEYTEYPTIAAQVAFCFLCLNDVPSAQLLLPQITRITNESNSWLAGTIGLCSESAELFERELSAASGRELSDEEMKTPTHLWLRVWDEVPDELRAYPSFYFPRLPSALTGLDHDLIRNSGGPAQSTLVDASRIRLPVFQFGKEMQSGSLSIVEGPNAALIVQVSVHEGDTMSDINGQSGDVYNIYGSAGAVGRQSSGTNFDLGSTSNVSKKEIQDALFEMLSEARRDERNGNQAPASALALALAANETNDAEQQRRHITEAARWLGDKIADGVVGVSAALVLRAAGIS